MVARETAVLGKHNLRKESFQSDTRLSLWVKRLFSLLHAPRSIRAFSPNLSFHLQPMVNFSFMNLPQPCVNSYQFLAK